MMMGILDIFLGMINIYDMIRTHFLERSIGEFSFVSQGKFHLMMLWDNALPEIEGLSAGFDGGRGQGRVRMPTW